MIKTKLDTMVDPSEFDSISPYSDEEAVKALNKVANHPSVLAISGYLFPDKPFTYLRNALKKVKSVDDFQEAVMNDAVNWCIDHTVHNFSYDGISYIKGIKTGTTDAAGRCLVSAAQKDGLTYISVLLGCPMETDTRVWEYGSSAYTNARLLYDWCFKNLSISRVAYSGTPISEIPRERYPHCWTGTTPRNR